VKRASPAAQQLKERLRAEFLPASEELKSLVAAMENEVSSWPQVRLKPMFGMTAIYRNGNIFGLLPKTRSLHSGDSVWMKFAKLTPAIQQKLKREPRIVPPRKATGAQWHTLSGITHADFGLAIEWLAIAHAAAKKAATQRKEC
jgi:TfoX/Sxy family transcriptional regulator of competence genes